MASRTTLVKPPALDPSKAQIENALELTDLSIIGPDIFTNTRELWHPPGARGIYGGVCIAQTLAAAQRTVPDDFYVHSYHCYFVLAGDSTIPILYHVERVREGRSFATRTVQARQRGKAIFTVTMSFMKDGGGGDGDVVSHAAPMPSGVTPPPEDYVDKRVGRDVSPFQSSPIRIVNKEATPGQQISHQWIRARGKIVGGHQAHLSALAYMSDSDFIGAVSRFHRLWRFPFKKEDWGKLPEHVKERSRIAIDFEGFGGLEATRSDRSIGMMVSLDHAIYFHNPKKVQADDWMLTEVSSPWAGDGRGVVTQKIYGRDGTLLATCFQEGVVRLRTPDKSPSKL